MTAEEKEHRRCSGVVGDVIESGCLPGHLFVNYQRRELWGRAGRLRSRSVRVPGGRRDALRAHLSAESIGSEVYYPIPLHRQECFADLQYSAGSLPETERAASEVLSLTVFPGLTLQEQERVVDSVCRYFVGNKASAA